MQLAAATMATLAWGRGEAQLLGLLGMGMKTPSCTDGCADSWWCMVPPIWASPPWPWGCLWTSGQHRGPQAHCCVLMCPVPPSAANNLTGRCGAPG